MKIRWFHGVLCVGALGLTTCAPSVPNEAPDVLLFNATGASPNDVRAIEAILKDSRLPYATVSSQQLNGMSDARLRAYRLMIVPGGNYITMGNSLTPDATTNVRNAVENGLNYLGICAGGLLAGNANANSFNLVSGVRFGFYEEVNRGIHKAAVRISGVEAPAADHYWEDGPEFSGWGTVVGKYPDGTPAIVEGASGKGWVILCGVHPEAPENWRHGMTFGTPVKVANDYARTLIGAALDGTCLPHY
jgi:glutamine amidotransferase-like uncharacterized protein